MDASMVQNACPNNLVGTPQHIFMTLINTLISAKCPLGAPDLYPEDYGPKLVEGEEYDFIIVGAGSAGSVLANKLTEVTNWRVLLIEAGDYPSAMSDIPAVLYEAQGTKEDWHYKPESDGKTCQAFIDQTCLWPRGKVLGGSSSVNGMMYVRGNQKDYKTWAEMGNQGWEWERIWKLFQELEGLEYDGENRQLYGKDGPLKMTYYTNNLPLEKSFFEAAGEMGYKKLTGEDPLEPLGYMQIPVTVSGGTRANAARMFLGPAKRRPNLFLSLNSLVTKVIIDKRQKSANGVEVRIGNKLLKLRAKKEVILSAGAVNSPQLLMLSGVGPRTHLKEHGIETLKDLPVGENLQDHFCFQGFYIKLDKTSTIPVEPKDFLNSIYDYFMYRKGGLGTIYMTNLMGFLNTKNDSIYPNIQMVHLFYFIPNDPFVLKSFLKAYGAKEYAARCVIEANRDNPTMHMMPVLLKPKSRGRILLRSNSIDVKPLIYPGYFSDKGDEDINTLLEAIRFLEKFIKTDAFVEHKAELVKMNLPECEKFLYQSDDYWRCSLTQISSTLYHPVGSCGMGPVDDGNYVVDSRLRVHGIKNLRVVDASIMPTIVSGNTNAPTMVIGLNAGIIIKEDWTE